MVKKHIIQHKQNNDVSRVIKDRPASCNSKKRYYDLPLDLMVISIDEYNELNRRYRDIKTDELQKYKNKIQEFQPVLLEIKNLLELKDTLNKDLDNGIQKINTTNNLFTNLIEDKNNTIQQLEEKECKIKEELLEDKKLLDNIQELKSKKISIQKEISKLKNKEEELNLKIKNNSDKYNLLREEIRSKELTKKELTELYNQLENREQEILNKEYKLEEGFKFIDKKKDILKQLIRELEIRYQRNFSQYKRFQLD